MLLKAINCFAALLEQQISFL